MNIFFPILAALFQASSFTIDKAILSRLRVSSISYIGASFPLIFFITLGFFLFFRPLFPLEFFAEHWLLLLLSIVGSAVTNVLYYRALKNDTLQELQSLDLLQVIPIIIFSGAFFRDERNTFIIIPACVAAIAVAWSHWEHHHFRIGRKTLPYVAWSLAIAPLFAPISKILLTGSHPISLELIRSGGLAVMFLLLFGAPARTLSSRAWGMVLVTNTLTSAAWILFFMSFQRSGIIFTLLIFSLQPLLVYFASIVILKEPVQWKKIASFFIILLAIGFSRIMTG